MAVEGRSIGDYLSNLAISGVLGLALALPYRRRVALVGWITSRIVAPIAGWRARIRANLARIRPDLPESEVRRLMRAVPDNAGRSLIEIYSGAEFKRHVQNSRISGAGLEAIEKARDEGRPVILLSGHFGNYDVARAVLSSRGYPVAGLYAIMRNGYFNDHWVRAMGGISQPMFPTDRRGLAEMIRFMRGGGMIGMLIDQHAVLGAPLRFFGQLAHSAISAAEMALKYDALLVPMYGIRQPDGTSFELVIEEPLPHTTPEEMTQSFNDSLERQVRAHMDQWLWIHRRWKADKVGTGRKPAAGRVPEGPAGEDRRA